MVLLGMSLNIVTIVVSEIDQVVIVNVASFGASTTSPNDSSANLLGFEGYLLQNRYV